MPSWIPTPEPIFIAVVGATGVGKSTFIKGITNDANIEVGTSLKSCTKFIEDSRTMYFTKTDSRPYQLHLLDTPGFDDDEVSDADILTEIATWLKKHHQEGQKLSGIIYLHKITDDRMGGQGHRNLTMLRALCGDGNLKNVILVTNRWEQLTDKAIGTRRVEKDLLGAGGFWRHLILNEAEHMPYDGTLEKAYMIIDKIISRSPTVLQIQEELASGIPLMKTEAGRTTTTLMERDFERREKAMATLLTQLEDMRRRMQEVEEEKKRYEALLEKQRQEKEALTVMHRLTAEKMEKRIAELEQRSLKKGRRRDYYLAPFQRVKAPSHDVRDPDDGKGCVIS